MLALQYSKKYTGIPDKNRYKIKDAINYQSKRYRVSKFDELLVFGA